MLKRFPVCLSAFTQLDLFTLATASMNTQGGYSDSDKVLMSPFFFFSFFEAELDMADSSGRPCLKKMSKD